MRGRAAWTAALGAAALALLVQAPAAVLVGPLEDACAGRCRIAAAEGPWWRGEALIYLRSDTASPWSPAGTLRWRLAPGGLRATLDGGRIALLPTASGLKWEASGLRLPAAPILSGFPGLPRAGWGGTVELAQASGRWLWSGSCSGEGALRWAGARTSLVPGPALGDYRLDFKRGAAGPIEFTVAGERGVLEVEGQGSVLPGGAWRIDLQARAADGARAMIEPLLRTLGQPLDRAAGSYRIRWPAS